MRAGVRRVSLGTIHCFFSPRPYRTELAVALRAFEVLRVENTVKRDGRRGKMEEVGEWLRANEEWRRKNGFLRGVTLMTVEP